MKAGTRLRRYLVWQHRVTGLAMAIFVAIIGLTGSLLAIRPFVQHDTPQFKMLRHGPRLNLAELAIAAEKAYPHARTDYLFAPDDVASVRMEPRINPQSHQPFTDVDDVVLIDPWTGERIGKGEMHMGTSPGFFGLIFSLHENLTLGAIGQTFVGYVALVLAVDCLVGLYLTFPINVRHFWKKWSIAWRVKLLSGPTRFNFDLHRASGLWVWPLLFLISWSGVRYNLSPVYNRVLKTAMPYESDDDLMSRNHRVNRESPKLTWQQGYERCVESMDELTHKHGLKIIQPRVFAYIGVYGVYSYGVQTSGDFRFSNPISSLYIDGDTGALRSFELPNTIKPGNWITQLSDALHLGDFYGPAYRYFEALFGVIISALSVTGVLVWWQKRKARQKSLANRRAFDSSVLQNVMQPVSDPELRS